MKLITLTEANQLEEMIQSDGWHVYKMLTDGILKEIEESILSRSVDKKTKDDLFSQYYHLQDFMKIPSTAIHELARSMGKEEAKARGFDPYHTVSTITKDQ